MGWNTRNKLAICNDCEKTQIGSRFKFVWAGGEYAGSGSFPATLGLIMMTYRDPGENIFFYRTDFGIKDTFAMTHHGAIFFIILF